MLELFSKLFWSIAKSSVLAPVFREIFQTAFKSNFVCIVWSIGFQASHTKREPRAEIGGRACNARCTACITGEIFFYAALAQPAEHSAHNRAVAGSTPARGMIYSRSSSDEAAVSKTAGCRFESCRECQIAVLVILQYSRASGGESTGCSSTPPIYVVRETECILAVLLILTFSLK